MEEKPKEDPEEEVEEEPEVEVEDGPAAPVVDLEEEEPSNDDDGDSDTESEVINPPYPIRVPAHRMGPNGPTPLWGVDIWRWSKHQGKRPPYGMAREFYDLRD